MSWKEQLAKAVATVKEVAESETARNIASKAKITATTLAKKAREGALDAADAFVRASADPSTLQLRFLNADVSIVAPCDGLEITRPSGATLAITDGRGNGLIINAAADKACVSELIGEVTRLGVGTYHLGSADGENVVVLKT